MNADYNQERFANWK